MFEDLFGLLKGKSKQELSEDSSRGGKGGGPTRPLAGARTRPLGNSTQPMARSAMVPAPPLDPAEKAEASEQRRTLISAYRSDPTCLPEFHDPKFVYKIVADERTYQMEILVQKKNELKAFSASWGGSQDDLRYTQRVDVFQDDLQATQITITQLFYLLKELTGVKGKTGGTGFLSVTEES